MDNVTSLEPAPWYEALGAMGTQDPKPVCCTSPKVELPLHVHSSLSISHCILEKNCFNCAGTLECVGRGCVDGSLEHLCTGLVALQWLSSESTQALGAAPDAKFFR